MKKTSSAIRYIDDTTAQVTKAFMKQAAIFGTDEFKLWREYKKEFPGAKMVTKSINKNPNQKTRRNMTFKNMEEYIKTQPNSEKQLITFAAVQRIAEKKGSKYPLTKKWFLNAYPEYKENEVSTNETAELEKLLEAEQKKQAEQEKQLEAELDALMDDDTDNTIVDFPNAANL